MIHVTCILSESNLSPLAPCWSVMGSDAGKNGFTAPEIPDQGRRGWGRPTAWGTVTKPADCDCQLPTVVITFDSSRVRVLTMPNCHSRRRGAGSSALAEE